MNEELELSAEQLRVATSRTLAGDAELDPETAAMRESFLSLGVALKAAASTGFDEDALISKLRSSVELKSSPLPAAIRGDGQPHWWWVLLAGALAAAALIAIGRVGVPEREPAVAVHQSPAGDGMAEIAAGSAWRDPLDEQIASAQLEVQQLANGNRGLDGSLSDMNDRLNAMSQELLGGSL